LVNLFFKNEQISVPGVSTDKGFHLLYRSAANQHDGGIHLPETEVNSPTAAGMANSFMAMFLGPAEDG